MTSSNFHCVVYCNGEDSREPFTNESKYDENGNILPKFFCNHEGKKYDEKTDANGLKFIISHHIETMSAYFSGESLKYIRKLVSFKNFTNESICDSVEIFVNVFIRCMKCCLKQTNNFRILCQLRESIESVLIFMNSCRDATENDQVDQKFHSYKIYVVFGLLLDVELLASCYQMETFEMIENRLSKHIDRFLGGLSNQSIAIFYSTEFLNSNAIRNYADICIPILERMLLRNSSVTSAILLFKLWTSFPLDLRKNTTTVNDFLAKEIREEDMNELRELASIFSTIPKNCENIAELFVATEVDITEAVQQFLKTQEELLGINFTVSEAEMEDSCANLNIHTEEREEKIDTVPIWRVVDSEHDYCSRFTSHSRKRSSKSVESASPEEWTTEDLKDEYLQTDESVEIELCDLCVELGTLAIDSYVTDITPCTIRSLTSSSLFNVDDINPSGTELVSQFNLYFTDPVYQLHCDTCEADEKCFSQQYDYILSCRSSVVDVESIRLPKMMFPEELRCQCLSCHNNLECLKKNFSMLTEYAREREEKIEELTADHMKPVTKLDDSSANFQGDRVPSEYKRSASKTLEHKLPLKKRKFSFDHT